MKVIRNVVLKGRGGLELSDESGPITALAVFRAVANYWDAQRLNPKAPERPLDQYRQVLRALDEVAAAEEAKRDAEITDAAYGIVGGLADPFIVKFFGFNSVAVSEGYHAAVVDKAEVK